MPKFNIGDTVEFIDKNYTINYPPARQFLNKEGVIIFQRDYAKGKLIKVQFENGILEAYEKRFDLIKAIELSSVIERKIKYMYERQPYYKTLKGKEQCAA